MKMHKFFVVLAPGQYGHFGTRVVSSHYTLDAARRGAATPAGAHCWFVVRRGGLRKGDSFGRVAESIYPIVE